MKQCKTYVYRDGLGLVDVTDIVQAAPEPRVHLLTDRGYENLRLPSCEYSDDAMKAPTLTVRDLSSRTKHRAYMKEKGLCHVSDFGLRPDGSIAEGSFWDRARAKRERLAAGTDPENNQRLHASVVDAMKKLEAGYRPAPAMRVEHDEHEMPVIIPKE